MTVGQERALLARLLRESVLTLCRETMASHRRLIVDGIVLVSLEDDDDNDEGGGNDNDEGRGQGGGAGLGRCGRRISGEDDKSPVVVTIHEQLPKVGELRGGSEAGGGDEERESPNLLRTILRARKRCRPCDEGEAVLDLNKRLPSKYYTSSSPHSICKGETPMDEPVKLICRSHSDDANIKSRITTITNNDNSADSKEQESSRRKETGGEEVKEEKLWFLGLSKARHTAASPDEDSDRPSFTRRPSDKSDKNVNSSNGSNNDVIRDREMEITQEKDRDEEDEGLKMIELDTTLPAEEKNQILRSSSPAECQQPAEVNSTAPAHTHEPSATFPTSSSASPSATSASFPPTLPSFPSLHPPRRCSSERPPPSKLEKLGKNEEGEHKNGDGYLARHRSSQDGRWSDPTPLNLATRNRIDNDFYYNTNAKDKGWRGDDIGDLSTLWKSCSISDHSKNNDSSVREWRSKERETVVVSTVDHERGGQKKGLRCARCRLRVADVLSLERHNLREHACFTCHVCLTTFTARNNLKRHARVHTGYKPYQCPTCRAAFFRRDDLKNHCQRHINKATGDKSNDINKNNGFVARGAPAEIAKGSSINGYNKNNINTCWPRLRPYGCKQCGRVFLHPSFLRWHMANRGCRRKSESEDHTELNKPVADIVKDAEGGRRDGDDDEGKNQDGGQGCPRQQSSWCTECQRGFPDEEALIQHITHTHENGPHPRDPQHRPDGEDEDHRINSSKVPELDSSDRRKGISGHLSEENDQDTPMESTENGTTDTGRNSKDGKSLERRDADTKHGEMQSSPSSAQHGESNSRRQEVPKGPSTHPCEEQANFLNDDEEESHWISQDAISGGDAVFARRCASASPSYSSPTSLDDSRLRAILSASRGSFQRTSAASDQPPKRSAAPPSFMELVRPNDFLIDRSGSEPRPSSPSPPPANSLVKDYVPSSWPFPPPVSLSSSEASSTHSHSPPAAHSHNVQRGGLAVPRHVDNFLHVVMPVSWPASSSSSALSKHFSRRLNDCRSGVKEEPMSDVEDPEENGMAVSVGRDYPDRDSYAARGAYVPRAHGQSFADCCPPFRSVIPSAMTSVSPYEGLALGFAPPPLSPNLPTDLSMNRSSPSGSSPRSGCSSKSNTSEDVASTPVPTVAAPASKPASFEKVVTPDVLYRERSPFRCAVKECADLQFTAFSQLEEHSARLHRRYLCEYCGKSFTAKPNRDRHVRYHTGHRPYKCSLCSQAFYRGDDLKYHRTTKHTGVALQEQGGLL